jgi:hypothetical protein
MKKTRILTLAVVAVAVVLCVGAVGAYGAKTDGDITAPVTTSTIAASYVGDDVAFDLHATDASGVSYVYYRIDKDVAACSIVPTDTAHTSFDVSVAAPIMVAAVSPHPEMVPLPMGSHTLKFWSQDVEGNVEAQNIATFVVNPELSLKSSATSVKAGRTFTLSGMLEPDTAAAIRIQAKAPGASSYATIGTMSSDAKGAYSFKYKTKAKGIWSFRTQFQDVAKGLSAQSPVVKVRIK